MALIHEKDYGKKGNSSLRDVPKLHLPADQDKNGNNVIKLFDLVSQSLSGRPSVFLLRRQYVKPVSFPFIWLLFVDRNLLANLFDKTYPP